MAHCVADVNVWIEHKVTFERLTSIKETNTEL